MQHGNPNSNYYYKLIQIITIITNITIITKYSKILLQITTKNYYKLRQLISLQNSKLLQITSSFTTNYGTFIVITNYGKFYYKFYYGRCYKLRRYYKLSRNMLYLNELIF